eukprot:gene3729-4078_t
MKLFLHFCEIIILLTCANGGWLSSWRGRLITRPRLSPLQSLREGWLLSDDLHDIKIDLQTSNLTTYLEKVLLQDLILRLPAHPLETQWLGNFVESANFTEAPLASHRLETTFLNRLLSGLLLREKEFLSSPGLLPQGISLQPISLAVRLLKQANRSLAEVEQDLLVLGKGEATGSPSREIRRLSLAARIDRDISQYAMHSLKSFLRCPSASWKWLQEVALTSHSPHHFLFLLGSTHRILQEEVQRRPSFLPAMLASLEELEDLSDAALRAQLPHATQNRHLSLLQQLGQPLPVLDSPALSDAERLNLIHNLLLLHDLRSLFPLYDRLRVALHQAVLKLLVTRRHRLVEQEGPLWLDIFRNSSSSTTPEVVVVSASVLSAEQQGVEVTVLGMDNASHPLLDVSYTPPGTGGGADPISRVTVWDYPLRRKSSGTTSPDSSSGTVTQAVRKKASVSLMDPPGEPVDFGDVEISSLDDFLKLIAPAKGKRKESSQAVRLAGRMVDDLDGQIYLLLEARPSPASTQSSKKQFADGVREKEKEDPPRPPLRRWIRHEEALQWLLDGESLIGSVATVKEEKKKDEEEELTGDSAEEEEPFFGGRPLSF